MIDEKTLTAAEIYAATAADEQGRRIIQQLTKELRSRGWAAGAARTAQLQSRLDEAEGQLNAWRDEAHSLEDWIESYARQLGLETSTPKEDVALHIKQMRPVVDAAVEAHAARLRLYACLELDDYSDVSAVSYERVKAERHLDKVARRYAQDRGEPFGSDLPTVVCLCGSTRFFREFQEANFRETMAGKIVLSVGFYPHAAEVHGEGVGITPDQKRELDELHKRKIDMADEILVLNVGGYIGESTASEIRYARTREKDIRYLEPAESAT